MEKRTPHIRLQVIRTLLDAGAVRATGSAFVGARELGIETLAGMCDVVRRLTPRDFHKSMTTHADHHVWQDVYHGWAPSGRGVYLKLTVLDGVLIVSFKEL
jgi:motility quorum-sensing regulator/GCU-specific mRNA interferase toxin